MFIRACCVAENGRFLGSETAWESTRADAAVRALNSALIKFDPFARRLIEEEDNVLTICVGVIEEVA